MTIFRCHAMSESLAGSKSALKFGPGRERRFGRFFGVKIERTGRETEKAVVSNISSLGMGGKDPIGFIAGERVTVLLPLGVRIVATVCWCERGRFGLRLDRMINPEAIRFSEDSWKEAQVARPVQNFDFEAFRPASSTKRPGFRVR
jgi:hypothetical protein